MIREKPRLTIRVVFVPNFEVSDTFTTSKVNIARRLNHHDESKNSTRFDFVNENFTNSRKDFPCHRFTRLRHPKKKKEKLSDDCCVNIEADNIMF